MTPTFDQRRKQLLDRYNQLTPKRRQLFRNRNLHPTDLDGIAAALDELENPTNLRDITTQLSALKDGAA